MTYLMNAEDVFSLKKHYEIPVLINGSDQLSIKEGMQSGLSSLLINMTGSSKILERKPITGMLNSPEKYISQYKLELEENKIKAIFLFQGDDIRAYLSANALPLWLAYRPVVLSFLPCKENLKTVNSREEEINCKSLESGLMSLANERKSRITAPLMDLIDIDYFESLISVSPQSFMTKLSKRYDIDAWLICFTKDEFGILLEVPQCISSLDNVSLPPEYAFNKLLDEVKSKKSLVVNKDIKSQSLIRISGTRSYDSLEQVLEDLKSQILVYDVSLRSIKGNNVEISLSHFGNKNDLKNLLNIHDDFKEMKTESQAIISYEYTKG